MSRLIYTLLFYLAQPLIGLRLLVRSRKQRGYLAHLGERYGYYRTTPSMPTLWIHVVSVGETRAAEPLIKALLAAYPDHSVLMTHMTPTGRATGAALIEKYGDRLQQAYLPYDLPGATRRFLTHFRPRLGFLMETEIWPNLIHSARALEIPLWLINARLSERSMRGYLRLQRLIRPALQSLSGVIAQTSADAERLMRIGSPPPQVFGNLKFDVTPDPEKRQLGKDWRRALGSRPVFLAASTREGEEALILDAWQNAARPDILLLIVPRHPQRFNEIAALIEGRGLTLCRRSDHALPNAQTAVWLGDSMGEMPAYFSVAQLTLIGGTLLPFGGQNLIEAAACACPILVGPHTYNFAQATEDALAIGAARRVQDAEAAIHKACQLLSDERERSTMEAKALDFSQAHQGATERLLNYIAPKLGA